MGDPKKQRKKYVTPAHPWRTDVLKEELSLLGEYGLRNKRELWRTTSQLRKYRTMARKLLGLEAEERRQAEDTLVEKLYKMGLLRSGATCEDVLQLNVQDFLERRLQTLLLRQGKAHTIHQARQLIAHRHVKVAGRRMSSPSYRVMRDEEEQIEVAIPIVVPPPSTPSEPQAEEAT